MPETKREKSNREKRLSAFLSIAQDHSAEVRCPKCRQGTLFILAEAPFNEQKTDLWIQCSACLITETMTVSNRG